MKLTKEHEICIALSNGELDFERFANILDIDGFIPKLVKHWVSIGQPDLVAKNIPVGNLLIAIEGLTRSTQ